MFSYQDFLIEKDALGFESCSEYYGSLLEALDKTDKEAVSYWKDFVSASVDYAQARGEWLLLNREEKQAKDEMRTVKHNKVILALKIVIAYLKQQGKEFDWFESITGNRKQMGDLACYVAYVYSVNAR